jgi:predicted Zn-dependent peptidase
MSSLLRVSRVFFEFENRCSVSTHPLRIQPSVICLGLSIIGKKQTFTEPKKSKITGCEEKREISNSYLILGYKTIPRNHKDSYVLDVIRAHLGRGQSGKMYYEIRTKQGLGYDVGVHHSPGLDYGFFAVYLSTEDKNINKCKKIVINQLDQLASLSEIDLKNAIDYIEGSFYLQNEDTFQHADALSFWEMINNAKLANAYIKKIKCITMGDIKKAAKKYFSQPYAYVIISPK